MFYNYGEFGNFKRDYGGFSRKTICFRGLCEFIQLTKIESKNDYIKIDKEHQD